MISLATTALLLLLAPAMPGVVQPTNSTMPAYSSFASLNDPWRVSAPARVRTGTPQIRLPMAEQFRSDGSRTRLRGVIVGTDVAPNMNIGLGLLSMKPRRSSLAADPALTTGSRGSRKAALRFTMKF